MFKKILLYIIALGLIFVGSWITIGLLRHVPMSIGFIFTGGKAGIMSGSVVILRFVINVLFIICGIGLMLKKIWAKRFTVILILINLFSHLYGLIFLFIGRSNIDNYFVLLLPPIFYLSIIAFLVLFFPKTGF